MEITSIRVKKNTSAETRILGVASIQLDNCLVIHDIKLIKTKMGRAVSFPSRKIKKFHLGENGYEESYEYADLVHPSNAEFRKYIEQEIFKVYDMEVNNTDEQGN